MLKTVLNNLFAITAVVAVVAGGLVFYSTHQHACPECGSRDVTVGERTSEYQGVVKHWLSVSCGACGTNSMLNP